MRFNSYVNGSYGFAGISAAGGALTLPLKIQLAPTSALDAVNRLYATTAVTAIVGSSITGTFASARLPSYTGADVSSAGAGVFTLSNTGVTAATYAKVTVDNKGRVTTGGVLVSGDVPNLSYTKLIDRPTTLAGYGITDMVSLSGSTMTGPLLLNGVPTASTHLVSKSYVDTRVGGSGGSAFVTGDIVSKSSSITPSGFFRCNGGAVSKTTYAPLFSLLGYTYNKGAAVSSGGKPWCLQYNFNNKQIDDITGWVADTSLPVTIFDSQVIVTSSRVYLMGGYVSGGFQSVVYTAPINSDGTLGAWSISTSLPAVVSRTEAIVTNSRVYLIAGAQSSLVYTASINIDGTLGTWSTANPLPGACFWGQIIVTSSRVYVIGGNNGAGDTNVVYTAPINSDGTLGAWSISTSLPAGMSRTQAIVTKNRVYLTGDQMFSSPINADGTLGAWSVESFGPGSVSYAKAVTTNSRVYLLCNSSNNNVVTAPINADGTLGTWTYRTALPVNIYNTQVIVTSSRIYTLGGIVNGAASSAVYSAPFLGGFNDYTNYTTKNYSKFYTDYTKNSGGKPWCLQYGFNTLQTGDITGWTAGTVLPTFIGSTQVVVTKNRAYYLGGYGTVTHTSAVYTAPINADGTLGTWVIDSPLPLSISDSHAVIISNRLYLLSGRASGVWTSAVYTAPINADGTLGTWTTGTSLPGALSQSQAIVTSSRVYLLGGYNGTNFVSTVYTAPIDSTGTIGTWTTGTALPIALASSQSIVTNNIVYLLGGTTSGTAISSVYTAPINTDGTLGSWATGTVLPLIVKSAIAITTSGKVYLLGGNNGGGTNYSSVYTAPINADGTLGTWAVGTALPVTISDSQAIVTNNRVHLLTGNINAVVSNAVYSAPFLGGSNDYAYYAPIIAPNTFRSTAGKPWRMQYDFNDQQTTDITAWSTGTALPLSVHRSATIFTNNRVFLLGGFVNNVASSAVYTAPVNTDGTLGAWTTATALPVTVSDSQAIITNGRAYLIGGLINGVESANTYTAVVNLDGTLGAWTAGTTLPATSSLSNVILTNNRVHLLSGSIAGVASTATYTASVTADGIIGTWTTGTALPVTIQVTKAILTKSRVYLIGGLIGGVASGLIYTATIATDGTLGVWSTTTSLPATVTQSQAVVTNSRVYVLGGAVNGTEASTVYTAPIDTDGIIGTWTTGTALPGTIRFSQAIITTSKIYMLGGSIGGSFSSTVFVANFLGGSKDYTNYFIGADIASPLTFTLPDFSLKEAPSFFSYIKF